MQHFPEDLRRWRVTHGLTQEEAAKKFGVARTTYIYWERGRNLPTSDHFETIRQYIYAAPNDSHGTTQSIAEIARSVAIEVVDDETGRVLLQISYVVETGKPVQVRVKRG